MKTITVSNGDIQLNNGQVQFVTGSSKLAQDLALWLKEPLGTGYTTPGFGSQLSSMVGQAQGKGSVSSIQSEVFRVLQLYQGQQVIDLQKAQNAAQLSNWNRSEIIQSIDSVTVVPQGSAMLASVSLTTLSNTSINLNISIDKNGVSVTNG